VRDRSVLDRRAGRFVVADGGDARASLVYNRLLEVEAER
jgi:hypothetical protein